MSAGEYCNREVAVIKHTESVRAAINLMRMKGVRRLPVVNDRGELQGLLTVDDMLELIVEQLIDIAGLVSNEMTNEIKSRY